MKKARSVMTKEELARQSVVDHLVHGVLLLAIFALTAIILVVSAGCAVTDTIPVVVDQMPPELMAALMDSVGSSDGSGGFRSPTDVPVGESDSSMQMAHAMGIIAGSALARRFPKVIGYAQTTIGASTLLLVVNKAGCPISKGVLIAGGWTLVQTDTTEPDDEGKRYRLFGVKHGDGRVIGIPTEALEPVPTTPSGGQENTA